MCLLPNAGKAGEAAVLLTGFAARLAATLDARMAVFEDQKAEASTVEKDAKTIAALGRAAIIVHALKAAEDKGEDKSAEPSLRLPSAHNDNHGEGDEMEPDERAHTGRSDDDLAALRRDVERRFERLARSFEQKAVLSDGAGGDPQPDERLLAGAGENRPDPAFE